MESRRLRAKLMAKLEKAETWRVQRVSRMEGTTERRRGDRYVSRLLRKRI